MERDSSDVCCVCGHAACDSEAHSATGTHAGANQAAPHTNSDMDLNTPPQTHTHTHTHTQCAFVWTEMKEVHGERSNQQLKVKVCSKLAVLSELKRWAAIESIDPRMSAIGAMMS